jgi:SHS2 domain-containing protein
MRYGVQRSEFETKFETFEHEADIGVRGFGASIEEAFEHAAGAMYSVMIEPDTVEPAARKTVFVEAPDSELLLVEWLNALLSLTDIERMVFSKFKVKISGTSLSGIAWGEPLDRKKHEPKVEIKGATYHMLKIEIRDGRYIAQCVVDV